jgi:hypothetical protein
MGFISSFRGTSTGIGGDSGGEGIAGAMSMARSVAGIDNSNDVSTIAAF